MAAESEASPSTLISNAIVAFALDGRFPETEDTSSLKPTDADLSVAAEALLKAKSDLEVEISAINDETKDDVASWVANAKTLQEDILRSKTLADDIVRKADAPDVSGKAIQDADERVDFIQRELRYSEQLLGVLRGIDHVNQLLGEVEAASNERRILDSLHLLERAWAALDDVGVSKSCRVMKLLDLRTFELKSDLHEMLDSVWSSLVQVDLESSRVTIFAKRDGEQMTLSDTVMGLKAYKEVEERMIQLWHNIDAAIVSPRMKYGSEFLPRVQINGAIMELEGKSEPTVDALLSDLQNVAVFLSQRLPPELLQSFSPIMMEDIVPKLLHVWLDSAVPTSLREIDRFEAVVASAKVFCAALEETGLTGFDSLKEWVDNAPATWLSKCRETALDSVRSRLSTGIGASKEVEKIERQMVTQSEGRALAANGPAAAETDDWGAAWDDGEEEGEGSADPETADSSLGGGEDDGADAWGWDEEGESGGTKLEEPQEPDAAEDDEDDSAAAWGWGDEGDIDGQHKPDSKPTPRKSTPTQKHQAQTRELVLRETYNISSMPQPVLDLIFSVLEDGAALTHTGFGATPFAAVAAGLFGIPTLALAMFRGVSPYYYSKDIGGSMYLYNDATYLAEKLGDFATAWKEREDLSTRARSMLRLDNDIRSLQNFANRAYSSELSLQKTVLRDLLGGAQSLMNQDEMDSCIDSAVARIRSMAVTWEPILSRSVWYQAVGSLADSVSQKVITDVMDMVAIGQDEAYSIAQAIAKITELDDLFLPSRLSGGGSGGAAETGEFAMTPQYAGSWLRLKYLSEVLQSNLNEVRYLWFESELSLYFSAEEVLELIRLSFEDNPRSREVIKEVVQKPHPLQG